YANSTTNLTVVVNNGTSSVTSAPVVLVVNDPIITAQPTSQTNIAGSTASFSVTAAGTPTVTYQWYRRGTNAIGGVTSSPLSVPSVSQADATNGSYTVVVSGAGLSVTSSAVSLTVLDPPSFTAQPKDRTVVAGNRVAFAVGLAGATPFSYQWLSNGVPV